LKLLSILILSASMLAACGGGMDEEMEEPMPDPVAEAPAPAAPAMTHPEIMQEISSTRPTLQSSIESEDGAAAAAAGERIAELFQLAVPEYESRGLAAAVEIANGAADAAAMAATEAEAGNFEAALAAHGNVQAACGSCHSQFREKTPDDQGYQFKAMP
jgi:hypothetical protein